MRKEERWECANVGVQVFTKEVCTVDPFRKMKDKRLQSGRELPLGQPMGIVAASVPSLYQPKKAVTVRRKGFGDASSKWGEGGEHQSQRRWLT